MEEKLKTERLFSQVYTVSKRSDQVLIPDFLIPKSALNHQAIIVYRLNHQMPQEPTRSVGSAQQDPKRHTRRQTLQSQGVSPSAGFAIGGLRCT